MVVSASERGWNVGDEYMWKLTGQEDFVELKDEEMLIEYTEEYNFVETFRIIEIDELNKEVTYETLNIYFDDSWISNDTELYNTQEIFNLEGATWLGVGGRDSEYLFYLGFEYDDQMSKYVAGYFRMNFPVQSLIEPNWVHINDVLATGFNSSVVIGGKNNNYGIETTLGEFLSDIPSYTIMGKSNLNDARDELTSTTRRWTFEFDLSGYLYGGVLNESLLPSVHYNYIPIDKYIYRYEIGYTEGGVLEYMSMETDIEMINNGHIMRGYEKYEKKVGGFEAVETSSGNNVGIALVPFMALPVGVSIWKRKQKLKEVV
jgi:hypothetical protein